MRLVAKTTTGRVEGVARSKGLGFFGIPYAAAPVGPLRFRPPEPPLSWDGVRSCTQPGAACPQSYQSKVQAWSRLTTLNVPTDEDCLFLNVFTPGLDDASRPTMVWLHGGGYILGHGMSWPYDGQAFVDDDVVLVTINYRLHAFGFLYVDEFFDVGDQGASNNGLRDQIAALAWVHENIRQFGGDPDNVTVFGQSAGGISSSTLMAMSSARGLFNRAIPQSGGGRAALTAEAARQRTEAFLETCGVRPGDWDALQSCDTSQLLEAANTVQNRALLGEGRSDPMGIVSFQPVVDGVSLPDQPVARVREGCASDIDLLVGTTADELRAMYFGMSDELRAKLPDPDLQSLFAPVGESDAEVLDVYAAKRPGAEKFDLYAAILGDGRYGVPARRLADAQAINTDKVWMYQFSWPTPVMGGVLGAMHALELPFVFDQLDCPELVGDDPPHELARELHGAWVRFARSGDPGGGTLPNWPAYNPQTRPTMFFDEPCTLVENPDAEEHALWEGLV